MSSMFGGGATDQKKDEKEGEQNTQVEGKPES